MQEVELHALYQCLSTQRIGPQQQIQAIERYKWDIALSEELYPLLHIIEVGLRNRLHTAIGNLLVEPEWLLNKNDQVLQRLERHWLQKIATYTLMLDKKRKLDEGHLIAELNFGFWTTLLSGPFEYQQFLWPRLKSKVFPYAHGVAIKYIRERFDKIRRLRNRIFHYGSLWDQKDLIQQHEELIEAIHWLEPALLSLIKIDRFSAIYTQWIQR